MIRVMADSLASQLGGFEPQRVHNFAVEFQGLSGPGDNDLITLSLVSAFTPQVANDDVPLPYGNEYVYVAGKAAWQAGSMVVRDFVDRPVAETLWNWRSQVYNPETGAIGLAADYKKSASILLFGPNSQDGQGTFEREWEIRGVWPTTVNFGDLNMQSSDMVMIQMGLRFDKAFATSLAAGGAVS